MKICLEAMKFYYKHKTFCELYNIDIEKDGKALLKSIIRKFNEMIKEEKEENEENFKQKACLILIYNCNYIDLIDINFYSLINNNSSYIIIYNNENYRNEKEEIMEDTKLIKDNSKTEKNEHEATEKEEKDVSDNNNMILPDLQDSNQYIIIKNYEKRPDTDVYIVQHVKTKINYMFEISGEKEK